MSDDKDAFGFGQFVPGFDFLQNLAKGSAGGMPQMPSLSSWVAPTLNVEELDKRIGELKAVQFWLEQNGRALQATIQALEVQKMTLATLQGMNFSLGDLAESLQVKPDAWARMTAGMPTYPFANATTAAASAPSPVSTPASAFAPAPAPTPASAPASASAPAAAAPAPEPAARSKAPKPGSKKSARAGASATRAAPGVVDPMQWWGSLTEQFQQIAAGAFQDVAQAAAGGVTPAPLSSRGSTRKSAGLSKRAGSAASGAKGPSPSARAKRPAAGTPRRARG